MFIKLHHFACLGLMGAAAWAGQSSQDDAVFPRSLRLSQPNDTFDCGTPSPSLEFQAISRQLAIEERQLQKRLDGETEAIVVDTYVHIVLPKFRDSRWKLKTNSLKSRIPAQIRKLNDDFAQSGISFVLKDDDVTYNDEWAQGKDEGGMKAQLRRGSYSALNLYYVDSIPGGSLFKIFVGICRFPRHVDRGNPASFSLDGCLVRSSHMGYATTTHEVGHWLGLMHTFQNGCDGDGDSVDDTPAHRGPTHGLFCWPRDWKNSCPSSPGYDPVRNFMNYLPSMCSEDFTPGQIRRMKSMWNRFRK